MAPFRSRLAKMFHGSAMPLACSCLPDGRIDASVSAPHDDEKSWLRSVAFLAKAKGKAVA